MHSMKRLFSLINCGTLKIWGLFQLCVYPAVNTCSTSSYFFLITGLKLSGKDGCKVVNLKDDLFPVLAL